MLVVYPSGSINNCQAFLGNNAMANALLCKVAPFGSIIDYYDSHRSRVSWINVRCYHSPFTSKDYSPYREVASKRWLCRSRNSISPDDEYRSSRNIAISLLRRYRSVIDRGAGDTLKEFIVAGVNAYALGCTDEGLRKELNAIKELGMEIEGIESDNGSTRTKSKIALEEIDECILWLSIVFITILCTPQPTIVRWSSTPPVSDDIQREWRGFCAVIANAYYIRGMAWLPVKTLQLEQMAVMGRAEEPSVVASRMRLVFSTLEVVSPQWPRV